MFMTIGICLRTYVYDSDTGHTFSFYSFHVPSLCCFIYKVSVMQNILM